MSMKRLPVVIAMAGLLGACATSTSDTYTAEDVGKVISTAEGTVVSSREVEIEGETGPVGALAGGAAGGAAGYGLSGGGGAITVLGALVGAGVGYLVESGVNDREGIEYVIQMDDGRVVTLVQNKESGEEAPIQNGAPVLVQYGDSYTRIVELPQNVKPGSTGTGGWINPDTLPPGEKPPGSELDSDVPGASGGGGSGGDGENVGAETAPAGAGTTY